MTGLILVGLIPFAVLGILLGHLLTVDSMGPAMGGVTSLFALLGGAWGPTAAAAARATLVECLPSYWLVQAGKTALRRRLVAGPGLDRARRVDRRCSARLALSGLPP